MSKASAQKREFMPLFERLDRRLTADEALKLQLPNFSFPERASVT